MTILYPTQQSVLDGAKSSYLYNLGTSSGKTLISIYHYLKHYQGEPLLIVQPPQKLKTGEWADEIDVVEKAEGITIRYDQLSVGMLAKKWQEFKGYFVIFDEAHLIKTPTSKRGKAALHLSKVSSDFVLLTATAAATWEDTINYFLMFGFYKNKTQFFKEHAILGDMYLGNRVIKKPVDWKEQDDLKRKFNSFSIKKETTYFVDLPDTQIKDVTFKSSREYNTILKDRVLEIDDEMLLFDTQPKLQSALRYYANQKDKLSYTEMLADGTDENILIFYQYTKERDKLLQLLKKLKKKVFEVNGQNFHLPTKEERPDLKNSVTICQYQSGSAAIELQYCNQVIFYTPTYSYIDYTQAMGRAVRHGNKNKVTIYRYQTNKTIETAIYGALKNKRDFTEELFRKELKL
ncbi:helicase-related protein [Virgibacillus sp. C22-A2]|uniref:Helicase-related protein n=1 Tax=Virgibacillus tibetensis TaxID=3042313 RepID=A0ABU6KAL2_9BACI|nr:helicase-related protein [Virgibacillus sp. C22-A2]